MTEKFGLEAEHVSSLRSAAYGYGWLITPALRRAAGEAICKLIEASSLIEDCEGGLDACKEEVAVCQAEAVQAEELRQKLDAVTAEKKAAEERAAAAEVEYSNERYSSRLKDQELANLEGLLKRSNAQLSASIAEVERHKREAEEASQRALYHSVESQKLKNALDESRKSAFQAESRARAAKVRAEELEASLVEWNKHHDKSRAEEEARVKDHQEKCRQVEELAGKVLELQNSLNTRGWQLENMENSLREKEAELELARVNGANELTRLRQEVASALSRKEQFLAEIRHKNDLLEAARKEADKEIAVSYAAISSLKHQLKDSDEKIQSLHAAAERTSGRLAVAEESLGVALDDLQTVTREKSHFESLWRKYAGENEVACFRLKSQAEELRELNYRLEKLRKEYGVTMESVESQAKRLLQYDRVFTASIEDQLAAEKCRDQAKESLNAVKAGLASIRRAIEREVI